MKNILFVIGTLLKALIILIGLGFSIYYFVMGLSKNDGRLKRKALRIFLMTVAGVFVFSIIEYTIILMAF